MGDVERNQSAEELARAFVAGRLAQDEFDARVERSLSAVTDVDLARLTSDLRPALEQHVNDLAVSHQTSPAGLIRVADAVKVVAFQAVLIFVALVLGADLDNEVRSNALIAFEVWIVGTAAGTVGFIFGQRRR